MSGGQLLGGGTIFTITPESGIQGSASRKLLHILQLWYFQSVTRQVSVVTWVSASRRVHCSYIAYHVMIYIQPYNLQVNKKFRKFERKYRDCIKRNGDKIGTQTCYEIST